MNNSWPKVKLGEVISHRKEFVRIDDLRRYKRCRVQLYAKGIVLRDLILGSELKTKEQQVCHSGDFLVAEIDAKVGGYGIVPDELEGAIVSSHYFLFEVDQIRIDSNFLGYFVKTPEFFDQVSARGTTNYAAIRPSHVLEYQIPLPPLEEQRRIVAKIDKLAAKIEEVRRLQRESIVESEALLRAELREIFCSREPQMLLGEALELHRGFDLPVQQRILGPYPVLAANGEIGRHVESRVKGPGVCTGRSGSVGAVNYVGDDFWPLNTALYVSDFKGNNPRLIYYLLLSVSSELKQAGAHTAVPTLDRKKAHSQIRIHLPLGSEQRQIVDHLDWLAAKTGELKRHQKENAVELGALVPSILDKAFRGEL
jgi:type I restriction enzyme S subunit